ncbi:hypothetical protein HYN49_01005 [Flavobacterium pallidum]|uniref:Uncharacterized protein n=1 Tax=Flavobacterium pallidum TaxID=2172098 RepID=A0A2S1SL44_9FLAO|nr:hypothetical protein HYN49_01005 [Flavobacterium pallidum]
MLFKPLFPIVEYFANYNYIATVLCENKDKPQMKCNGKCHLMKEMAKAADGDKPADKKAAAKEAELLFFQEIKTVIFAPAQIIQNPGVCIEYSNLYSHLDSCATFHPPNLSV